MSKKTINTDGAPSAIATYSQAVQSDNLLFISGQIPLDPETMTWSRGDAMVEGRTEHSAVLLPSGGILVTGGATRFGWLDSAEIFTAH